MMSHHSGWIILLLIIYPLQVGTLILILVTHYIALAFVFASTVHYFKKRRNQELSLSIFMIGSYFFFTLAFFLIVYYLFLAKYPHEDSITKFIPSLLPIFFIGICTWIAKNIIFKVIDYDKRDQNVNCNEENPIKDEENTQATYLALQQLTNDKVIDYDEENQVGHSNNENQQNNNNNENPQNSNNENPHESEIVNPIEDKN